MYVRELAAWTFDQYEHRPESVGQRVRSVRAPLEQDAVLFGGDNVDLRDLLEAQRKRRDLQDEMKGLEWSLGLADLRYLVAFQRRLAFHPRREPVRLHTDANWQSLVSICFRRAASVDCEQIHEALSLTLRSHNPNLQFRFTGDPTRPILVHTGSPFLEVARLRGRWFLRDGYHRAYDLLRQGIFKVPAVILEARSLDELGAAQPWFFSESILFSEDPPTVIDFLDDALTVTYERAALTKTLRITMEEILAPASPTEGDEL